MPSPSVDWKWDTVDGVATCCRLDIWIWTPVGASDYLFLLLLWTSPGDHRAVFTVGNGSLCWEYSSQGMELITHPNLVLIFQIGRALPLLLYANFVMLWSDLYLYVYVADCSWTQFLYISKKEKQTIKVWNPRNLQRKFASFFQAVVTGK